MNQMKISPATIEKVICIVQRAVAGNGITVRAEVQDEGAFLLITAAIPTESAEAGSIEMLLTYEKQILQHLPALLKPRVNGGYSWMVVFIVGDKVVYSVMDTEGLIPA